ncbi:MULTISPECIES: DMT family transporter [Alistipes]|uniref:DMT family transporter n=1 Tax=Alistipes TaxID=239759 RepID=UPI001B38D30F|nr:MULTISPECIES: DMT family transporter [Alistipes]MBQ4902493.1 DMT family transporter [Alistipes sp. Marseille-P2263]MCI2257774.1 DMT family transporter [Alistipes dispar]
MARLSEYRYHLAALFTVSVWGATFVSTKALIAAGLTPAEIFLMRFALGYLCILPLAPRRLRAENRRDEAAFAAAGVCGGSLYFLLENVALEYAPASNVSLLVCTAPVWTALAAGRADRSERMTRRQAAGAALAAAGMALVVLNGRFVLHISPAGDLLALAAALSWMGYSLVIKRLGARYPASFIARKVFFYGMATILPVFAFRPFAATGELLARPVVWANLLFLGVVASGFCYALWNAVMRRLGAVRATNYIFFNPLVTMLTAALCIGERITAPALAGAAMILCGMWHAERR